MNSYDPSKPEEVKKYFDYWYSDISEYRCNLGPIEDKDIMSGTCSGRTKDGSCIYRPERVPCSFRIERKTEN